MQKWLFRYSPQILSEIFPILRRNEGGIVINVQSSSCRVPVILVRFKRNINLIDRFL